MAYNCYELPVRELMVVCRTFRKWRFDHPMPDIPEVEIWRAVLLWMFLLSLFSLLLFTSLLLWIPAQYKWCRHEFLPLPETSQVEVEFLHALDPPNGYHMVLIGCETYGFVRLRTLNSDLIVSFPFYSCTGLCSPGGLHLKMGIM
jgi:hypothetical protein